MADFFTNKYLEMAKECIPTKVVNIRRTDKPWFNSEIRHQIRIRDRLHRKLKSSPTVHNRNIYKIRRNKVNNMIIHAKEQFYLNANRLLDENSNNPKAFRSLVKKVMGNCRSTVIPPLINPVTNDIVVNESDKANVLNNYFCSISSTANTIDPPKLPRRTPFSLDVDDINDDDVKDILKSLQIGKASGGDFISHQMLKNTADTVYLPLKYIFNHSLRISKYPSCWKIANVLSLFKKGDKSIASNYRPIALLSCRVGKVFERIVFKYIYNYMLEHKLLYKFQSGFVSGHSTSHQLIELYHQICIALENGQITVAVFCDISKAFDRLWHKGLIEKLKSYGINGKLLKWLKDYISERKQQVLLNNSISSLGTLKAGVPQRSVLDSLLFLLFINDIADHIQSLVRLFADDSSLIFSSTNPLEVEDRLNLDLQDLDNWAKQWLVDFNPQKTEYMVISFRQNINPINVKFNSESLNQVDNHKHLGVTISSNGKWAEHINNICQKATKQIFVLRKLKFILNRNNLNKIYVTYILPLLEYACELWDGCCSRDADKLEQLQVEAARIITGLPKFASKESLYFETGWETLSCRRRRRKLTLFHKIHNNIAPEYLQDCLNEYLVVNNYNLRNSLQYRVSRCRLETFSKSFFPSTIRSWNSLDPNFKSIQTTSKFKQTLRANLFKVSNYYLLGSRKCNIIHTRLRHQCSSLGEDLFRANIVSDPSCAWGCPLEDAIHYLLECPLYTNARMQLIMSITPYTVISIKNLLFGSDNLTDENNLIVFRNVQKYIHHSNRFE